MQMTGLKGARLSLQQERLWSLQRESRTYRAQCAVLLEGRLDVKVFQQALRQMIEQHEILHTLFYTLPGMNVPVQVIEGHPEVFCPTVNLEDVYASFQEIQLNSHFTLLRTEAFDLAHGPLFRTVLFRLSAETHLLLVSVPALCADAATLPLIIAELSRRYEAYLQGRVLAEEPLQCIDISAWQNKLLSSESAKTSREFWSKINVSQLAQMRLPFEREGRRLKAAQPIVFEPHMLTVTVEDALSTSIGVLAQHYDVSVAAVLLACWHLVLWRLTDEPGRVIGVACDGRLYEELTDALGLYTRFVPVSIYFEGSWTFEQVVTSAGLALHEAMKWQTYFTWAAVHDGTDEGEVPDFFPVTFEYGIWPDAFEGDSLTISLSQRFSCTEPFALKLGTFQVGEHLQLELHYDPQRLTAEQARRLSSALYTLLHSVVEQPQVSASTLRILAPAEQEHLLTTFCGPTMLLPVQGLHQLFEAQVLRMPGQLALVSAEEALTYQELNYRANQLAHWLRRRGVGPHVLVGLCLSRSAWMIIGLLAILKAGGAYVPLDPENPPARLDYQLQDIQAVLLLTQQVLLPRLPQWNGQTLCLETIMQEVEQELDTNLPVLSGPEDLAYVIYTSGSTGVPKGVMIQQQSVVNYTLAMCELVGREPGWQFATVSTLAADLGNTAIFCALASGGCLQVLDYETITSGEAFAHWAAQHPIDVLKIVPSHLSALLASEQARAALPRRALVLGGEALPCSLLEWLREIGGGCAVLNHYGPTETTIGVLVNVLGELGATEVHKRHEEERGTVPLGRPIANIEVYVLDPWQQVVPVGVTGELYVGGVGLALGYLHQPEQTAERFVPHPFSCQPGARLYWTGDLARYTAQGQLEFVGRRDSQVKLRGYRIELGEVEAVIRRHPNVWDCVVVLREDVAGERHIVGYVVALQQPPPTREQLTEFVREHIPDYMVPSTFVYLKDLPLTPNGKVDRQRLPEPEQQSEEWSIGAAPRGPIEESLREIWKKLLAVASLGIHDDFFQAGGHSLLATQVISRVRAVLQVELSILDLFEAPTIAQLAQRVEQALRGGQVLEVPALVPVARMQDLPLSFAQQRLWFLDQLEPESTAYLLPRARRFRGTLDTAALERSLEELIRRHESLRTTFQVQAGQPVQIIHPVGMFRLPLVDLRGLPQEEREDEARWLTGQEAQHPCNLAHGPLLRTFLLQLDCHEHVLLVTMHHIISDGWSNDVFVRELTTLYQAFVVGQPSPLPLLPIQYADFAVWQRQWLQGEVLEAQLAYWKRQLAGVPPLELPTDHPHPPMQTFRGASQSVYLPVALREELTSLSQQGDVTLFMLLLAAFQVLLARYTGQTDISVGTPIANRTHAELEGLIGFFINTLVLRTDLSGNPSFVGLLAQVREVALGAYMHQDVPFEYLVEVLQPVRDLSRSPLFQVMFSVVQQTSVSTVRQEPFSSIGGNTADIAMKFDLEFTVVSCEQGLLCDVAYNTDLFDSSTMSRLLEHFHVLLEGIVSHSDRRIAHLPLLTPAERQLLLGEWNNTQRSYPLHRSFCQLFAEQADRTPYHVAITSGEAQITYQDLDQRANQLAHYLRTLGVEPEVLVGLCMERSLEMVVAILGIFKAGGAYLPLDPSYPPQHLALTLQDAGVQLVITQPAWHASLPVAVRAVVCLEPSWQAINGYSKEAIPLIAWEQQLAYVIYTSGSTGRPKGAMVTQVGMLNHLFAKIETLQLSSSDTVAQTASHCFDISVWQFLAVLLLGGRVDIFPNEITHDPLGLFTQVALDRVSILEVVPSLLRAFLEDVEAQQSWTDTTGNLRWLIATGEMLSADVGLRWLRDFPQVPLLNAYGPTECSDDVTHARLTPGLLEEAMSAPIGQAIANIQIYIVDEALELVPIGVPGHIYVGGVGVGRGYLGDAARSAAVFLPDPFDQQFGRSLYKTGDIGRYRENGQIEFMRRLDQQVKVRGYRIELGEIEATLGQHPAVREQVVLVREDTPGDQRLVAYVVGRELEVISAIHELQSYLREKLPNYMIPAAIVVLDALPLTPNGKVDRQALPSPETSGTKPDKGVLANYTPVEELIIGIWCGLLGRSQVDIHEDFFELGGHSLLATQVISRVRAMLGVEVPLRSLFEAPTIAELARRVEQVLRGEQAIALPPLVPVPRTQDLSLSFAQQRLWFLDQLEPGSTAYLIPGVRRLHGPLDWETLERSFAELVRRHESLRTTFQERAGQPVQVIHPAGSFRLPLVDLQGLRQEKREDEVRRLIGQEAQQPCDLTQGPLLRGYLLRLDALRHMLLVTMHHIISDGWSNEVFGRELTVLYRAFAAGQPSPLAPLPIQYADFALWQRQWLQGEVLEAQLTYWTRQLGGASALELPADHPRPPVQSHRGAVHDFIFSTDLSNALVALTRQEGVTLFMTLLAAFQILFYRYTGQVDLVIGTDSANRNRVETEGIIGFFVNLLVLRTNLSGKPSFREVLRRVREMVLSAYTHQDAPFELLVEKLAPSHALDRMPLVQVLFVLQNLPTLHEKGVGVVQRPMREDSAEAALGSMMDELRVTKFDLALFMQESAGRLHGALNYSLDLFEASTIATMMARFEVLLQSTVKQPDVSIDRLEFLTEAERVQQEREERERRNELHIYTGEWFDLPEGGSV